MEKISKFIVLLVAFLQILQSSQVNGSLMECSYDIVCSYDIFGPEYCNVCKISNAKTTSKSEVNEIKITNYLPEKSLPIRKVEFFGGEINFIPKEIYEMSPIVHVIYVRETSTKVINQDFFGNAENLTIFVSFNNSLKNIGANSFETANNLDKLLLTHNELEEVHSDAFKSLKKLTSLFLGDNKLEKVDPLWFQDLVNIREFHIENNKIHTINGKDFLKAETLSVLKMDHNELVKISPDAFKELHKLTELRLHQNKCIDEDFVGEATDKTYTSFGVLNSTVIDHVIKACA